MLARSHADHLCDFELFHAHTTHLCIIIVLVLVIYIIEQLDELCNPSLGHTRALTIAWTISVVIELDECVG